MFRRHFRSHYLQHRFDQGLAASTVQSDVTAFDNARRRLGLSPLRGKPNVELLLRAFRRQRPKLSKYAAAPPLYAPVDVLPFLSPVDTFDGLRERALSCLRVETLMRPGEPASIRRSSVVPRVELLGRRVVTFHYSSKGSNAAQIATDTNYVSHCCDQLGGSADTCPACLLLRLCAWVAATPLAGDHDALFTTKFGEPLARATLSSIITSLLRRAGLHAAFTAHSLRAAANQALELKGVAAEQICVRAGWSMGARSSTRVRHYLHFRLVRENFAALLLIPSSIHFNGSTTVSIDSACCDSQRQSLGT